MYVDYKVDVHYPLGLDSRPISVDPASCVGHPQLSSNEELAL